MPTTNKWRDNGVTGRETSMNSKVFLRPEGVNELAIAQLSPEFAEIIFGDYTKWCSSLIFFPFKLAESGNEAKLRVGGIDLDVNCFIPNANCEFGYTLGEYHYLGEFKNFKDYEPYTTLQIYLPFYGFIDVSIADVINQYIQFRLNVDFLSGQAMYTIGVNPSSVTSPNPPYYIGTDDTNTRILSKYVFSLGVIVPLGQVGMADTVRNITMGIIGGAMSAGSHAILSGIGGTGTSTSSKKVFTRRNSKTGRQITTKTESVEQESDNRAFHRGQSITECFNTSVDVLNKMSMRTSTDRSNNPFVDNQSTKSIQIVRRIANVVEVNQDFGKLYGHPLGATKQLTEIHGYTEISSIHFEGAGFSIATNTEMAMIADEFSDGVILP